MGEAAKYYNSAPAASNQTGPSGSGEHGPAGERGVLGAIAGGVAGGLGGKVVGDKTGHRKTAGMYIYRPECRIPTFHQMSL
jgi:hypothetical protein